MEITHVTSTNIWKCECKAFDKQNIHDKQFHHVLKL